MTPRRMRVEGSMGREESRTNSAKEYKQFCRAYAMVAINRRSVNGALKHSHSPNSDSKNSSG